jgi:hypothetical protein
MRRVASCWSWPEQGPESNSRSDRITKSRLLSDVSKFDPQFQAEGQAVGDVTTRSRVEASGDAPRGLSLGLLLPSSRTVQCTFLISKRTLSPLPVSR